MIDDSATYPECAWCRMIILPTQDRTTIQGDAYHVGCWEGRMRRVNKTSAS
jgi:hypothetical protein